jgi:hypothetical protein
MDQQKLRTLVFEKTGVKIDVDDPVFALVALNEAVLAEAVERHVALLDEATAELAERLQQGGFSSRAPERQGAALPQPAAAAAQALSARRGEKRVMAIAGGAALLGALLVLLGQAIFFKPLPTPAPVVQARELSEAQASAVRNGEKLAKIVQKLDAKTRDKIQAELQKP